MKVKELIELLSKERQDAIVLLEAKGEEGLAREVDCGVDQEFGDVVIINDFPPKGQKRKKGR